ncbi:hypothetical protein [Actinoplanes sp. G11-F43]|uniref:hypothetical protein n=1 Tax=Actinoplanes sp. G11-F43 TaxID=3424130 RepID=UPI003D33305B
MSSVTEPPRPAHAADLDADPGDVCGFAEDGTVCGARLDDGEGYDGYCGPHADQLEARGHWG